MKTTEETNANRKTPSASRRIASAALASALALSLVPAAAFAAAGAAGVDRAAQAQAQLAASDAWRAAYDATGAWLAGNVTDPGVAMTGGEWAVIGLARSSAQLPASTVERYVANVKQALVDAGGVLHDRKYTEYSRVVIALAALGYDPADVAGYSVLAPLADFDKVCWQGVNGPIWALIALDADGYEIPQAPAGTSQTTREGLVGAIVDAQLADGGWALAGDAADADTTGMAIQALAPYYGASDEATAAVDRALACLSAMQLSDGGFESAGIATAESCAQVVTALTALGIDPATDARFVKDGASAIDALCSYAVDGGGFAHVAGGALDGMATEQGFCALAAYDRFLSGATSLFDMSDVSPVVDPTCGFTDVAGHWVVDEGWLARVVEAGAMGGYTDGTHRFAPEDPVTRGMAATILYRIANPDATDTTVPGDYATSSPFDDVSGGMYYTAAVNWCAEAGVAGGYTDGSNRFGPEDPVTREQLSKMLCELARVMGADVSWDGSALTRFPDIAEASPWAVDGGYLAWCVENGLFSGDRVTGELNPADNATRAQMAKLVSIEFDLIA